uniref:Uncharacterized protein n=1 Tax=Ciona intestinalis TaxID=7719 RepID=F6U0L8_CIOIN
MTSNFLPPHRHVQSRLTEHANVIDDVSHVVVIHHQAIIRHAVEVRHVIVIETDDVIVTAVAADLRRTHDRHLATEIQAEVDRHISLPRRREAAHVTDDVTPVHRLRHHRIATLIDLVVTTAPLDQDVIAHVTTLPTPALLVVEEAGRVVDHVVGRTRHNHRIREVHRDYDVTVKFQQSMSVTSLCLTR